MLVCNDSKIYAGTTPINKVYQGTEIIYEKEPPFPYTLLEYLESSGTQYIDTGVYPTDRNVEILVKFKHLPQGLNGRAVFGNYRNSGYYRTVATAHGGKWYFSGLNPSPYTYSFDTDHEVKLKMIAPATESKTGTYEIWENDVLIGSGNNMGTYPDINSKFNTMFLFTQHNGTQIETPTSYSRIYYFKILYGGELVRDFVPVLDENNIPCFYDKINKTCIYNSGTGEFLYELPTPPTPPTPGGHTELKSIIAHGKQRINTGIIPNDNTYGFEAKFCLENGESEGLWDWNIMNMGGTSVDNYRFGFGGWKALGGNTSNPNLQPAGLRTSNTITISSPKISYGTDYTVKFNYNNDRICYLDGTQITNRLTNGSYTYSDPWNIFCQTYNDGSTKYARFFWGKLYYLKIWLGTELVRDFIPVLDGNNVPCLYDKIEQKYYYNDGTGSFTYETLD